MIRAARILLVLSIWLLARPYAGIKHDARIYIGSALAHLDPGGVGRDALFALDAQTHLTAYSFLAIPLVHLFGASTAAIVLTYATLALWVAAAGWLAAKIMPGQFVMAALICAATLSPFYGPFDIFSFAEAFAVPRSLAEAGVLAAIAALLSGYRVISLGAMIFALAIHGPTALAGAAVVFIILAFETPILWLIPVAVGAAVAIAGLLHLGPATLLFQSYDPRWLAINRLRNPFLFESLWPASAWSQAIVSGVTLFLSGSLTRGRTRQLFFAALAVAMAGVLVGYLLGERPANILVLQLQTWRTLWLVKVLAIISIPLCASALVCERKNLSYIVLVLLASSWFEINDPWIALPPCLVAVALFAWNYCSPINIKSRFLLWVALAQFLSFVIISLFSAVAVEEYLLAVAYAAGAELSAKAFLPVVPEFSFFVAATAVLLAVKPIPMTAIMQTTILAALAIVAMPLAIALADHRDATQRMLDVGAGSDTLKSLLGPTPNGIFWVDNDLAPLFWVGRPTWANYLQGTAGAFSRPLAVQWDERSKLLLADGLDMENSRNPFLAAPRTSDLASARVASGVILLCKHAGGPDAIVAPGDLSKYLPGSALRIWHTPIAGVMQVEARGQRFLYVRRDRYSVMRCADFR